jgi:hypothetical protein
MQVREFSFDDICHMQEVAKFIRQQIGIPTLMACGAREFKFLEDGLQGITFKVGSGRKRLYMIVFLTSNDDYSIELRRTCKNGEVIEEKAMGVYCDQLSQIIYHMVNK